MSVLVGKNVSKSFGAVDVFSGLNFTVAKGDKIALVGPNGCGKTTLLRIIAGTDEADGGSAISFSRGISRGYLAQTAEDSADSTVWQETQSAFTELRALQERMNRLEQEMIDPVKAERALELYGQAQHEFEARGGYEIEARVKRVLSGLGFREEHFHLPIARLSGGQRVRAALARLLLLSPDVLLLDEPTNHLDTDGVEWLESFLQEWEGTLIVVSHDRYFIDEVCDHIWEMHRSPDSQSVLDDYHGSYTDFVLQRDERRERALKDFEAQREFIQKEEDFIRRNINSQGSGQARGRQRRLSRLEHLERPEQQNTLALRLAAAHRSGDRVLETHALTVGYHADRPLFSPPDMLLLRTERVALIGPNGTGKTTFLKTVLGGMPPLRGEAKLGAAVRVGYFAQAHEGLDPEKTILDELLDSKPDLKFSEARNLLGRFLFSGDDQFKKISVLSGGERGRVALAKLTLQGANVLLLDEPTNHLDIPSQEVITEALRHFDGTLLFVSHDRYLIAALATQLWLLNRDESGRSSLTVFKGTYDEWRNQRDEDAFTITTSRPAAISATINVPTPPAPSAPVLSKNQLQQRMVKLEAAEKRVTELEHKLTQLGFEIENAASDFARLQSLTATYKQTEDDLAAAWRTYEELA
ncbi:MAG: ABC-F family ATP-binding cassette domain-containing protein [Chloroflexi bacterium]|nr:ABC-F family ATP-binding cassette domain-containing protein [Chloroflexota bacterium]